MFTLLRGGSTSPPEISSNVDVLYAIMFLSKKNIWIGVGNLFRTKMHIKLKISALGLKIKRTTPYPS